MQGGEWVGRVFFPSRDKQEAGNENEMPHACRGWQARSPLTCTGHKGGDGTADALVVPGINSQRVCHPGIEVCQLYRLGMSLNRDSFFRMVAWGTETLVSLGPGRSCCKGRASVPATCQRAKHGERARPAYRPGGHQTTPSPALPRNLLCDGASAEDTVSSRHSLGDKHIMTYFLKLSRCQPNAVILKRVRGPVSTLDGTWR